MPEHLALSSGTVDPSFVETQSSSPFHIDTDQFNVVRKAQEERQGVIDNMVRPVG